MTFPNPLHSDIQPGSLVQADNVVISADNIVQSRRGVTFIGDSLGLPNGVFLDRIFEYQNEWLVHGSDNSLYYSNASPFTAPSWTKFSGTFTPPTGIPRLRGVEVNKNWYMTTNNGITKQAAVSATPISSGVPAALDGTATLATGSWFLSPAQVAYRITWSYKDVNGNLIEGAPSFRITITNPSGPAHAVSLTFTIPDGITTAYSYNIYRALQTSSASVPATDEMFLAVQGNPTSGQIAAKSVTVTDVTPEALLGQTFYGSPSQQGATQYNYQPPLALDICYFSNMTFFANTTNLQNVFMTMISVGSPNGVQAGDTITINGMVFTASATTQDPTTNTFKIDTGDTPAINIDTTSKNLVACINQSPTNTTIYAYYPVGYNDLPGLIYLVARAFTTASFVITGSRGGAFSPSLPPSGTTYASSNQNNVNSVMISKLNEPEAVPLVNQLFIGGGDQPILRVIALRDSVVVLKTDGIFRITGTSPDALTVTPFDTTIFLIAGDTAVTLNNSIYAVSSQMVVAISESGVEIVSRNIEGDLLRFATLPAFPTASFAVPYESERFYILFIPTTSTDTTATQIYVYNWLLKTWTRWTIACTAGLVSQQPDNKLYLGVSYNPSFLYQEIKTYNPNGFDFGDDRYPVTITGISGLVVSLTSAANAQVGQSLLQDNLDSVITAVDLVGNTVTVTDLLSWTDGAATLVRPINQVIDSTPIHGGFPHYVKNWTRALFDFSQANFSTITATFHSNVSLTTETVPISPQENSALWGEFAWPGLVGGEPWGGTTLLTQAIPTLVPRNKSYANWIQIGLNLNQALTNFNFLGSTATYDIVGDTLR